MITFTLIILLFPLIYSYSFDSNFPIVYHDPFPKSENPSFFGSSIVLKPGNLSTSWIQIGAPKANYSLKNVDEPGLATKCNILGNCKLIYFDDGFSDFPCQKKYCKKKLDHALLSSSMDITNERLIACGPKWIQNKDNGQYFLIQGACYWSNTNNNQYRLLFPLETEPLYKNREGVKTYYADFGEAGFSLHMISEKEFIVGAPGFANGRGTIVRMKDDTNNEQKEFTDVKVVNPYKLINIPAFSYNGYAVTAGRFFGQYGLQYVSSAPKRKYIGEVYIYNMNPSAHSGVLHRTDLQGKQLGEYFGYSLASGDINNDGFDDLLVGSPFYKTDKYNEGAVNIYFGKITPPFNTPSKGAFLSGKYVGGQFGTSVMFLGDIDYDGYADVAIGAPYEDEYRGIVYIFLGRSDGVNPEASQKLYGKDVDLNIKGFGYSISKPADIDDNHYHDLAIGAYSSGQAVLYRNRKSLLLHQNITNLGPPRLDLRFTTLPIQVCIWYTGAYPPLKIDVSREIIIDPTYDRGQLLEESRKLTNITLHANQEYCEKFTIHNKKPNILNNSPFTITVKQELILPKFEKHVINIYENTVAENQSDYFNKELPVLNIRKSQKSTTETIDFTTGCKNEEVCNAYLNIQSMFYLKSQNKFIVGSSDSLKINVFVKNTGEKAYSTRIALELPENIYLRNIKSNCHKLTDFLVDCFMDNPLDENVEKSILFDLDMTQTIKIKRDTTVFFNITVFTSSKNLNVNYIIVPLMLKREADLELTGSSEQEYGVNETTTEITFQTLFKVQKHGQSPINTVKLNIDIPIGLKSLNGLINFLKIFPPEYSNNRQPITCFSKTAYFQENEINDGTAHEEVLEENSLEEEEEPVTRRLLKRSVNTNMDNETEIIGDILENDKEELVEKIESSKEKLPLFLNCSNPLIKCARITCQIGQLIGLGEKSRAIIFIKAIMDTTVVSKYLDKHNVLSWTSSGEVEVIDPANFVEYEKKPNTVNVLVKFVNEKKQMVELWILIAAVLAGLVLLGLAIFCLIKAGFFTRTDKLKLQALKEAEQLLTSELVKEQMPLKSSSSSKQHHEELIE